MSYTNPHHTTLYDIVSLTPADPAAGANLTFGAPANSRTRLISVQFDILTDATVANRVPCIQLNDSAVNFIIGHTAAVVAASASRNARFNVGEGSNQDVLAAAGFNFLFGFINPDAWARVGDSFIIGLLNIQATDQISNVRIRFAQQITPL